MQRPVSRAILFGWRDVARLKGHPDFQTLGDHPPFREFLKKLEGK